MANPLLLRADVERLSLTVPPLALPGRFVCPAAAQAVAVVASFGWPSRTGGRLEALAESFAAVGIATLTFDPYTPAENEDRANRFDIPRMAERVQMAAQFTREIPAVADAPLMLFGLGTAAAACLHASVVLGERVAAIASVAGRPDLARDALPRVKAPTLCFAGTQDEAVLDFNRAAVARLGCEKELRQMKGGSALIDDAATLAQIANETAAWFLRAARAAPRAAAPSQAQSSPPMPLVPSQGFADRAEAGRLLGLRLLDVSAARPRIFALPTEALQVAAEVARTLNAPLDMLATRIIAATGDAAAPIAAIAESSPPEIVLDEAALRAAPVAQSEIAERARVELSEIERQIGVYREGRALSPLDGATAVLVDDGATPGIALRAALAVLARLGASTRILAVPELSTATWTMVEASLDRIVALGEPRERAFETVTSLYRLNEPTDEAGKRALLERSSAAGATHA
jgi:predicted phosphoribosyltransferase/predicted alpha/beta-hydrolase family hydrolase